ncbi:hypothetical protein GY14_15240 [Delftia tsuruhatensis]|nr:hypothetical protein GY14_15240 [Delftia tsuruhatensis]
MASSLQHVVQLLISIKPQYAGLKLMHIAVIAAYMGCKSNFRGVCAAGVDSRVTYEQGLGWCGTQQLQTGMQRLGAGLGKRCVIDADHGFKKIAKLVVAQQLQATCTVAVGADAQLQALSLQSGQQFGYAQVHGGVQHKAAQVAAHELGLRCFLFGASKIRLLSSQCQHGSDACAQLELERGHIQRAAV